MLSKRLFLPALVISLAACQAPQNVQQLQQKNQQLENELASARADIATLKSSEANLQGEVRELSRILEVMGTEKTSRVQESTQLRGLMRDFVQNQIDLLKDFLVKGDLLDYVGGELVVRKGDTPAKPDMNMLLVDLAHPIPAEGILTGVGAYFNQPGNFRVKVLRRVDGNLFVVWESKLLTVTQAGKQRVNFPVSVGVERGDMLAYFFPDQVIAAHDKGTGDTRTYQGDLMLGKSLAVRSLGHERERRAYSLGVYGLLK